jgi:predicted TIM-barrel fold metal-dependent hydrolase
MSRFKKIDLESHFFTPEYMELLESREQPPRFEVTDENVRVWLEPSRDDVTLTHSHHLRNTLLDLGPERIEAMDRVGIAIQFLSVSSPGFEQFEPEVQVEHARKANDVLADFIAEHPDRFVGLASLPVSKPDVAADELERCITELGFKGANVHSHIGNTYLDDARYFPILERAATLKAPINLHPTLPHGNMLEPYLGHGWALPGPGLGFGHETAVHAMRIVYSGAFDKLPDLEIILGHFGEGLMHWLYRVDFDFNKPWMAKAHRAQIEKKPSDYLRENFWYTSSGNWLDSALLATIHEVGVDRVMFATDYPWEQIEDGANFIEAAPISDADKEKICHGNAERLFGLTVS